MLVLGTVQVAAARQILLLVVEIYRAELAPPG
jgi:hypothetical protein